MGVSREAEVRRKKSMGIYAQQLIQFVVVCVGLFGHFLLSMLSEEKGKDKETNQILIPAEYFLTIDNKPKMMSADNIVKQIDMAMMFQLMCVGYELEKSAFVNLKPRLPWPDFDCLAVNADQPKIPRTKVDLKHIEDVQRRRVCFSKRRTGLMKKAHELSVLCNADIGVVVFSAAGKLYDFASSSIQQIIRRYITATGPFPDMSHLLAQQTEEIRNLKEELMMLKSENMSLRKDLEKAASNNQHIVYDNSNNMETALTLRDMDCHIKDLVQATPQVDNGNVKLSRKKDKANRVKVKVAKAPYGLDAC
ncbi:hypothetical protein E3N88_14240 [Mikania micrantha]|uniref:MADS-box domain-containing protein n=1 Tax=Mikania micrantha TaxID=192012 RepID=A0A5N6P0U7_9ASTR|nr:hypothetical protein E3N88_14240 [Mikania micrantha]